MYRPIYQPRYQSSGSHHFVQYIVRVSADMLTVRSTNYTRSDMSFTQPQYIFHFFFRIVYLAFLSLGLISGLKEIFHQEGVIGFFRGKFKSYFVLPYTVNLYWWTLPIAGHLLYVDTYDSSEVQIQASDCMIPQTDSLLYTYIQVVKSQPF